VQRKSYIKKQRVIERLALFSGGNSFWQVVIFKQEPGNAHLERRSRPLLIRGSSDMNIFLELALKGGGSAGRGDHFFSLKKSGEIGATDARVRKHKFS